MTAAFEFVLTAEAVVTHADGTTDVDASTEALDRQED